MVSEVFLASISSPASSLTGIPQIGQQFFLALIVGGCLNVLATILYMKAIKILTCPFGSYDYVHASFSPCDFAPDSWRISNCFRVFWNCPDCFRVLCAEYKGEA